MRNLLIFLGIYHLALGLLMVVAPGTFFEELASYGVQNDHYIRDNATIYLALGIAFLVAAGRPSWRLPVLALAGLQYVLHVINHAFDVSETEPSWHGPANLIGLALLCLLIAYLWRQLEKSETSRGLTPPDPRGTWPGEEGS